MNENVSETTAEHYVEPTLFGQPVGDLPQDLYIPPNALKVFLENFAGPLDLLLYLIKKQNLDILDIPIAKITEQYVQYIEVMREMHIGLAAEYLLMAAMLAEIKSRLLLPKLTLPGEEEEDPRAELVRKLKEYECFKTAAENLDMLPRLERDRFIANAEPPKQATEVVRPPPEIDMYDLLFALQGVLKKAKLYANHFVRGEQLSVRERMSCVLERLQQSKFVNFEKLFKVSEGKHGVIVTFVAILELLKQSMIEIVQAEPFAPIHVSSRQGGMEIARSQGEESLRDD